MPERVAPLDGIRILVVGSGLFTWIWTGKLVAVLPSLSVATLTTSLNPLATLMVVFHRAIHP